MLVTLFPTISMLLCSAYFYNLTVNSLIEACLQNFAAGLIIAAVAMELFPIMKDTATKHDSMESISGIILGFTFGLLIVHGVDDFVSFLLEKKEELSQDNICEYDKINDNDVDEEIGANTNTNDVNTNKESGLSGSFDIFERDRQIFTSMSSLVFICFMEKD